LGAGAFRARRLCFGICAALATIVASTPASADPGILLADARAAASETLATGEQLLLTARTNALSFAGKTITLSGFTGIVGYANELAYVVVLDGSASVTGASAGAGHMLILRPFGAPVSVEQFDAIRLAGKWSDQAKTVAPDAYASLERIKAGQELGVWFGRLGQTSFNVAASGSARYEQQTRTLMGDPAVRDIRFSGASDPQEVERLVVEGFLDALKKGDAKAAAALMDPTPFGGRALSGGADDARVMAASALIKSRNWSQVAGASTPQLTDGAWRAGDASLQLRTIDDFVFVSRISGGTK
jgi:hypothetical protein